MTTLNDIRAQYPQYKDVPDADLADAFYKKFYADKMSQDEFNTSIGYNATPEGEVGWLTPADDVIRTIADTATRGYADKLMGPEEQAHTARSRERIPDWAEMPLDVGTALVTSPYRVASAGWGALTGGLEGAADAYGHQKDWVPDEEGALDIAKGGGIGAGAGLIAGGAGDVLGRWGGIGKKGFKTDEELFDAAKMARSKNLKGKADLSRRAEKLESARLANIEGPKGFEKMLGGMDKYGKNVSRQERELLTKLANRGNPKDTLAHAAGEAATLGGGFFGNLIASRLPGGAAVPLIGNALKSGANYAAKAGQHKDFKKLQELLRGNADDPAARDALRGLLAKIASGSQKANENRR